MDTSMDEVYAMFGELVAVQGITMKRLQSRVAELDEALALAQHRLRKLEGTDDALGQPSPNGHEGREVPLADGGRQPDAGLSSLAPISENQGDER